MCGICGIIGKQNDNAIVQMVNKMHHRGPDDFGFFYDKDIALGMSRLAIIDLSSLAHQPMCNPEKTIWIVYNGEVYNFKAERALLETQGYEFFSSSDTEVIIHMYEEYGDEFLNRLRGMFALALYDNRSFQKRLLLARDPLGIKPLLWARNEEQIIFASEMKAILASNLITPDIDPESLRLLLTYGSVYYPKTMLKGISMLPPGHKMIIEGGRIKNIDRYWSLGLNRGMELNNRSYNEIVEIVSSTLEESVRLHMISDVPIGAFLSGGVDSSILVGMMTHIKGHRVKTFSMGFGSEGAHLDESSEAEQTARFLGSEHTRVLVTSSQVRDDIRNFAWGLDQPSVDGLNGYYISRAARQAVTVAISGTGGDELFAGYPWFGEMAVYEQKANRNPFKTAAERLIGKFAKLGFLDSISLKEKGKILLELRDRASFISHYATINRIYGTLGAAHIMSPELQQTAHTGRAADFDLKPIDELYFAPAVERVTALCLRGYTCNQLLRDIDAVSMAYSLEVRVPFLDVPLVELALSLPSSTKLNISSNTFNPWSATYRESGCKKILIDGGRRLNILPSDIDLQVKRGFSLPLDTWLKDPLRDIVEDTLSVTRIRKRGWLDEKSVLNMTRNFQAGHVGWALPWLLIILELWWQEVIESH